MPSEALQLDGQRIVNVEIQFAEPLAIDLTRAPWARWRRRWPTGKSCTAAESTQGPEESG